MIHFILKQLILLNNYRTDLFKTFKFKTSEHSLEDVSLVKPLINNRKNHVKHMQIVFTQMILNTRTVMPLRT